MRERAENVHCLVICYIKCALRDLKLDQLSAFKACDCMAVGHVVSNKFKL